MNELVIAIDEVMKKQHPDVTENSFHFNRHYRVGTGHNVKETIKLVFGKSLYWRLKLNLKNIRKPKSFGDYQIRLPSDSIFFYKKDKRGVIIVSPSKNMLLKMFRNDSHKILLDREIQTLKLIKDTDFEKSSSSYIADGLSSDGTRWLMTDFRDNSSNLKFHQNFEKHWFDISYQEIMPRMADFYKLNDNRIISVSEWAELANSRIKDHPAANTLTQVIKRIIQMDDGSQLLESINHYDLHAGNVLCSDKGHYSIIDWEGSYRAPVVIDAFDFLRRHVQKNKSEYTRFNELSVLTFKDYIHWLKLNFNLEIQESSKDLHFLIYAVERTLFFWEISRTNRMGDSRGMERYIISQSKT